MSLRHVIDDNLEQPANAYVLIEFNDDGNDAPNRLLSLLNAYDPIDVSVVNPDKFKSVCCELLLLANAKLPIVVVFSGNDIDDNDLQLLNVFA